MFLRQVLTRAECHIVARGMGFEEMVAPVTGAFSGVEHVGGLALARVITHEEEQDHLEEKEMVRACGWLGKITHREPFFLTVEHLVREHEEDRLD
jgi:hypothetical protein